MFYLNQITHDIKHGIGLAVIVFVGWMEPGSSALAGGMPLGPRGSPSAAADSASSPGVLANLTLEERIVYQRAIEQVYWRHRIWPKENLKPKPALDQVMPASVLQAKVEDDLRKSQALGVYWQRPITGEQLQAEMDRMARQTKQPAMLAELWAALGNDPFVIAECLARPALANRLIRSWYAHDERYHGELKGRANEELRRYGTLSEMRKMSGEYQELEWVKDETEPTRATATIRPPTAGRPRAR